MLHTGEAPANDSLRKRIMVMGPAAHGIAAALVRMQSNSEIHSANTAAEAIEILKTGDFDHLLIDNRSDGAMSLTIPALSRLESIENITVLAGPQSGPSISALPGVANVISAPYNPVEIANSLDIEIRDSREADKPEQNRGRRASDAVKADKDPEIHGEVEEASAEGHVEDERPLVLRMLSALAHMIPGLTPLLSLLYKNLALTVLSALFIAFVSYGIMIAYFLTSGDWSSPLQLQRGHELVIKAERDMGELKVKRNLVTQQLAEAGNKASRGRSALERAETLANITSVTITQETENHIERQLLIKDEIHALRSVLNSYGSSSSRRAERARLQNEFRRRIITRNLYQRSLLNLSEVEENIVNLREKISAKKTELKLSEQSIAYLAQLKDQLSSNKDKASLYGGKAEFIPIANQVIEVQQVRASGKADVAEYEASSQTLNNSLSVLTKSITELENTPMIRAQEQPVNVLFVPYDNLDAYTKGEHLYTCAIAIIWCSEVGTVGAPIGGEIVTTHPFFGKPIRGQFVEANLTEKSAAQKEIIHVGRPPLFF
jgi:hypothetical protein